MLVVSHYVSDVICQKFNNALELVKVIIQIYLKLLMLCIKYSGRSVDRFLMHKMPICADVPLSNWSVTISVCRISQWGLSLDCLPF